MTPYNEGSSQTSPTENPLTTEQVGGILDNNRISEAEKEPFRQLRQDPQFGDSKQWKSDRLRQSLIDKTKHPFYSNIKGKIPYAILYLALLLLKNWLS